MKLQMPMKDRFLLLLFCISLSLNAQESTHALLVGVAKYSNSSGWPNLSSNNDLELLNESLLYFGIPEKNISILKDEEVTKHSIIEKIESELIQKVKAGDFAIFHFSGHGQQILDKNADEIDGLDEALVPFNSPKYFTKGQYEGENLILDDDLALIFAKLRKKLGPNGRFLVTLDACHSGSSTRGMKTARGTDVIMADKNFVQNFSQKNIELLSLDKEFKNESNEIAPEIVLSSSSPSQLSYEYSESENKSYGLFTYALCKNLNTLSSNETYKNLLDRIKLFMSAHTNIQIPYAEGRLQEVVFGKNIKAKPSYYSINKIIAPNLIVIGAGKLQGITEGSKLGIFELKDKKNSKPIATGYVDEIGVFESDLTLEKNWKPKNLKNYFVQVIETRYEEMRIKLNLSCNNDSIRYQVEKNLNKNVLIKWTEQNSELYLSTEIIGKDSLRFQLKNFDGQLLLDESTAANKSLSSMYNSINWKISQFVRSKHLIALETKDNFFNAKFILLVKDSLNQFKPSENNEFVAGQLVKIKIENNGKRGFYFSVFDIQSDLELNTLYPDKNLSAVEYYLEPGASFLSPVDLKVVAPFGRGVLKLVCTREPVDYGIVRGNSAISNNPIQNLINSLTVSGHETRGLKPTLTSEQGYIGSLIYFSK